MTPIYAVGDIHGRSEELDRILGLIEKDGGPAAQIVFLGDYTDRGPDSRGVLDRLIAGKAAGRNWVTLKGNHDRCFEWFMQSPPRQDPHMLVGFHWFHDRIGGETTMASYGVTFDAQTRQKDIHTAALKVVPQAHLDFLRGLSLSFQTDNLFFAHAGIMPDVPFEAQDEEDLVWIREPFLSFSEPHPKLIVHGHTVVDQPTHYGNRVNLDGGAGYGRSLNAAVFEGTDAWLLTDQGRVALRPV